MFPLLLLLVFHPLVLSLLKLVFVVLVLVVGDDDDEQSECAMTVRVADIIIARIRDVRDVVESVLLLWRHLQQRERETPQHNARNKSFVHH